MTRRERVACARRALRTLAFGAVAALAASPAVAQRGGGRQPNFNQSFGSANDFYSPPDWHGNPVYDGQFTFARIKYRGYLQWSGREGPGWSHDYPDAEIHLMAIMREVTVMHPFQKSGRMEGGVIVGLDEPELFKYPVAYLSEPAGWKPNDKEVAGLRAYLKKGGFLIFDDMNGFDAVPNTGVQMERAIPGLRMIELDNKHPIFDSFFKIDLSKIQGSYGRPRWFAFYENNDPKKRMIGIVNANSDIGEYWQWSGRGFSAVPSNEAYKLGVNYLVYALTH